MFQSTFDVLLSDWNNDIAVVIPGGDVIGKVDDGDEVPGPELFENGLHRVLGLLDLLAQHRAGDVQGKDEMSRHRREVLRRDKVDEIAVHNLERKD